METVFKLSFQKHTHKHYQKQANKRLRSNTNPSRSLGNIDKLVCRRRCVSVCASTLRKPAVESV